ncbi:BRCA1-associated RING domain protein 1-like [Acanthaster planci]|uniref:BRCA1-associated RING domain protein 1-like n=1 Tax=Acanthaster planci TaxID=133434 RepID=A0A8B7YWF2_ACAPL|nr:BRCA1-associated RING domain protein 1-like [Acanthaster planci]
MEPCDWHCTREAVRKLEKSLGCGVCEKLLREPCTLGSCDHLFCRSCVGAHLGKTCPICHAPAWVRDLQLKRELASVVGLYAKLCSVINPEVSRGNKDEKVTVPTEQQVELEVRELANGDPKAFVAVEVDGTSRGVLRTRNTFPEPKTTETKVHKRRQFLSQGVGQKEGKKGSRTDGVDGLPFVVRENEKNRVPLASSSSSESDILDAMSVYDFVPSPQRPKPAAKKRARRQDAKVVKRQRVAAANLRWLRGDFAPRAASEESESGFDSERSARHVSFSVGTDQGQCLHQNSSSAELLSQDECPVDPTIPTPNSTQESGYATASNLDASNLADGDLPMKASSDAPLPNRCKNPDRKAYDRHLPGVRPTRQSPRQTQRDPQTVQASSSAPADTAPLTTASSKQRLNKRVHNKKAETSSSAEHTIKSLPLLTTDTGQRRHRSSPGTVPKTPEKDSPSHLKKRQGKDDAFTTDSSPPPQNIEAQNGGQSHKRSRRNANSSAENSLQTRSTRQTRKRSSAQSPSPKVSREPARKEAAAPSSSQNAHGLERPATSPRNGRAAVKRNKRGETPLHIAAIKGNLGTARQLLQDGADPNVKDNAGWTPLHEACNHGHASIVTVLLDHGALINTPGFEHDSPLHDAVMNYRLDVVKLLLERGASLEVRNMHGLTPADYTNSEPMRKALRTKPLITMDTNAMVTASQKSALARNQPVVLLGTGLKDAERKQLQACAKLLGGGRVVSEFGPAVTHLVASCNRDNLCMRTMKYLNAILAGVWIVSFNWAVECLKTKSRAAECKFEVKGTITLPSSSGAQKGRKNAEHQLPGLLDGCHFYLHSTFSPPTPSRAEIVQLIRNGGGTILSRQPKPDDDVVQASATIPYHARPGSELAACSYYIIHDHGGSRAPPRVRTGKLCTAPVSWLMDCISQFELLDLPN